MQEHLESRQLILVTKHGEDSGQWKAPCNGEAGALAQSLGKQFDVHMPY